MKNYSEYKIKVPAFKEANGFYTTKARSRIMSKIKATDTKAEIKLRKFLWSIGLRYRKNARQLPGRPDIYMPKHHLVIFVDGEFWHGYKWEEKKNKIKRNRDFWIPKIERNIQRDSENNQFYQQNGYTVMRFWEQQIKKDFHICIKQILDFIDRNCLEL